MSETGIVERLRESIGDSFTPDPRFDDCQEAASLIERQQKAIDLLLKAIEPFAISAKEQAERVLKGEES